MNNSLFCGICTALITPFDGEKIDFASFEKLIDFQLKSNVNALCFLGSSGECATITDDEFKAILSFAVKKVGGKKKVICGIGSSNTLLAIKRCKMAYSLGVDGLLAVTPYYNLPNDDGIFNYFNLIANASPLPIICYNVPKRTGVNISPSLMKKLCNIENICGLKQATTNIKETTLILKNLSSKIDVFCGDDILTLPMLSVGAKGVISVASNIIPNSMCKIYSLFCEGKTALARDEFFKCFDLFCALSIDTNPIPIKYATKLLGLTNGSLRSPLYELCDEKKLIVKNELLSLGIIL